MTSLGRSARWMPAALLGSWLLLGTLPVSAWAAESGGEITPLKTTFQIDEHDLKTGRQVGLTHSEDWPSGWSHVRAFRVNGKQYAIFVKSQQGKAKILRLKDDGTTGAVVGNYTVTRDITNVEIIRRKDQNPRLLLHSRINGRVAIRRINGNGELGDQLSGGNHEDFKYKDIVLPYQASNGNLFLLSISRWYGNVSIYPLQPSGALADNAVATYHNAAWKTGWSSAQIYQHDGQNYLIIYKIMDNAVGNEGGKIRVKKLLANGTLQEGNHQIPGDGTWTQGFSCFRVIRRSATVAGPGGIVPVSPDQGTANGGRPNSTLTVPGNSAAEADNPLIQDANFLLVYKIHNGKYKVLRLTQNGISTEVASGNLGIGWTDMDAYITGGKIFVAKLNEENRIPFDYKMVKAFEKSLQGDWEENQTRGGGYQVGITQSGRVIYLHAAGFAKRSTGKKMKTTDRSGIASVSKLFTFFTVIKMIEDGEIGLHDRLLDHFFPLPEGPSPTDFPFLPAGESVKPKSRDARVSELLNHTGRWESKSTSKALWKGRKKDKCEPNSLQDEDWLPNPNYRCSRGYQNANAGLAGWMLYSEFGLQPAEDTENNAYIQKLKEYWMKDAKVGGVFCGGYDDVLHYRQCDGLQPDACSCSGACANGYKEFERPAPGVCLSGSLAASTEDLLQFLNVLRYGKVMGSTAHSMIYQTEARDKNGNAAPFQWGHTLLTGEGWLRSKSGGGDGVGAYVAHFPHGVSVAIITNTKPRKKKIDEDTVISLSPSGGDAVRAAWTAATGISTSGDADDEE